MPAFHDSGGVAGFAIDWSTVLTRIETILRILALLFTGAWAYFRFIKGRAFGSHLATSVSGTIFKHNRETYMIVTAVVKNTGFAGAPIEQITRKTLSQEGTVVTVLTCASSNMPFVTTEWREHLIFEVFSEHRWIEPGGQIQETHVFQLPAEPIAVKLSLRLASRNVAWSVEDIIPLDPEPTIDHMPV